MDKPQKKKCGRCKEYRPAHEFYGNASRKDGLAPYCKLCVMIYRLNHKEQGRATQQKEYYANLAEKRLVAKRRMRLRRALMTAGKEEHSIFAKKWDMLCVSNAYRCFCCGREKPLHIDHVIPVAQGGSDDITNLQPLCSTCNRRKGDTYIDYRQKPNFGE